MSRRRTTVAGIQPPNLPPEVAPLPPPVVLSDEDAYSAVLIADACVSTARVTDLSLDQVVCRRVRWDDLTLSVGIPPANRTLNILFSAAWPGYRERDWAPVLERSLTVVCAERGAELVGFVNLAWDGGVHAFLLDTTVHPAVRRRGLGKLHVDYEPHLERFYRGCGFVATRAGLLRLHGPAEEAH